MAIKCCFSLALLLVSYTLTSQRATVTAIPDLPKREALDPKVKKPDCVDDRSAIIPGIGRATQPTPTVLPMQPTPATTGRPGEVGHNHPPHTYVPGNDDTFVPNPGFEVPAFGGGVPEGNNQP